METRKIVIGVFALVFTIVAIIFSGNMAETVDADEIVAIQDPVDGEVHWYIGGTASGGLVYQNFGTPTHYKKSFQFWFSKDEDHDGSIKVRFNDGGHATINGSVRITLPMDEKSLMKLHTVFGSQAAIENALVKPTIEKAVYMTGPLMSSKESYAERRSELLNYIEDQAIMGIYKTVSKEIRTRDPLSNEEKTVTQVEIVTDKGIIHRNSASPLKEFGVGLASGTLAFKGIDYDAVVEGQIKQQQEAIGNVQTAMANAKKAEQEAITVAKQGEAKAATAKWEQEVIKAKEVTLAQQKLEVQTLATKAAELYKQQQILEGQGEAEKKKLIMFADGALDKKLATYETVQKDWAAAFAAYKGDIVPMYQTGVGSNGSNGATQFMEIMGMKAARDLGLDLKVK